MSSGGMPVARRPTRRSFQGGGQNQGKGWKTGLGARHGRTNSAMGLSEDPGVYSGWTHVCMGDGTVYSKARARFGLQADAVCDELHRECQDPGQGLP